MARAHLSPWIPVAVILGIVGKAVAETKTLTLTTFYPAARGAYQELRATDYRDLDNPTNFRLNPGDNPLDPSDDTRLWDVNVVTSATVTQDVLVTTSTTTGTGGIGAVGIEVGGASSLQGGIAAGLTVNDPLDVRGRIANPVGALVLIDGDGTILTASDVPASSVTVLGSLGIIGTADNPGNSGTWRAFIQPTGLPGSPSLVTFRSKFLIQDFAGNDKLDATGTEPGIVALVNARLESGLLVGCPGPSITSCAGAPAPAAVGTVQARRFEDSENPTVYAVSPARRSELNLVSIDKLQVGNASCTELDTQNGVCFGGIFRKTWPYTEMRVQTVRSWNWTPAGSLATTTATCPAGSTVIGCTMNRCDQSQAGANGPCKDLTDTSASEENSGVVGARPTATGCTGTVDGQGVAVYAFCLTTRLSP